MASEKNKEIEKAVKIIDEMSMNPEEWEYYRSRQMAIMNYNIGMSNAEKRGEKRGEKKGEKKAKEEMAKKLLDLGDGIEKIIQVTGLTREEIEKINNS